MARPAPDAAVLTALEPLRLPDGRPLGEALEPWQRERVLAPILARAKGLPAHPLVWCELLKGAGKSTLAAAVAVAECLAYEQTWVDVAAVDADQGDIIGAFAAGFCDRTPGVGPHAKATKGRITFANGSVIQILSSDEPSAHGTGGRGRRYRVILDELTLWPDFALAHALLASTGKTRDVQTLVLTNPGATQSGEAWRWREQARKGRAGWHCYAPADAIKPGWITEAWRQQMRAALPPALYERFIQGRWSADAAYLSRAQVEACVDAAWAPQDGGPWPCWAGCDYGRVKDRCAIAVVGWTGDRLALLRLDVADPTEVAGGEVLIAAVEELLLWLAGAFPGLRRIVLDPWQLAGTVQKLRLRLGAERIAELPFGVSNQEKVSAALFNLVTAGTLRLYPDAALVDELVGLQTVVTPKGFRADHRRGGHNDRFAALAMAAMAAVEAGRPVLNPFIAISGRRLTAPFLGRPPVPVDGGTRLAFAAAGMRGVWDEDVDALLALTDPEAPASSLRLGRPC